MRKRQGGGRVSRGLKHVLFVRIDKHLLAALDAYTVAERARQPGVQLSRADVARQLLHLALEARP